MPHESNPGPDTPTPDASAASAPPPRPPPLLPTYASSFVGREHALRRLRDLLAADARLVTLTGAAGVGKTRLALRFATEHVATSPGARLAFCEAGAATRVGDLCDALARALDAPQRGSVPELEAVERLGRWLRAQGRLVLVVDGFERLAPHAEGTLARWHALAPELVVLVTSRVAMRLPDETVLTVEPLDLAPPAGDAALSEAAQLFLERVPAAARPVPVALAAEVAARLEGIPLAIELAAARLEVLSHGELRARLRDRFALLRNPTASDAAHATLWDAIDSSWRLLTDRERAAFAQLAVFDGGFTLAAAEAVVAPPADPRGATVLDDVQSLVRKSLVRVRTRGAAGAPRFGLYDAIREFARQRLDEAGGVEAAEARHAAYYVREAGAWAADVHGPDGAARLEDLATEHDNLRAVLARALARCRAVDGDARGEAARTALEAALALSPVMTTRGSLATYLRLLDEAIAAAEDAPGCRDGAALGWALDERGRQRYSAGDPVSAERDALRAAELARRARDALLEGAARRTVAFARIAQGRGDEAAADLEASLRLVRAVGHARHEALTLSGQAYVAFERGETAAAEALFVAALARFREAGDRVYEGRTRQWLGTLALGRGRYDEAQAHVEASLAILASLGGRERDAAHARGDVALVQHLRGDLGAAREGYALAARFFTASDERPVAAYLHTCLAALALEAGDLDEADGRLGSAVALLSGASAPRYEGIAAAAQACARGFRGDAGGAEAGFARAAALLEAGHDPVIVRVVDAYRAAWTAHRAEEAATRGDASAAREAHARAEGASRELSGVASDDVRIALRVLAARIARSEQAVRAWRFARDGLWFRAPGEEPVSLAARPTLARLLAALVAHRLASPAEPLSVAALVRAGWGDVKLVRAAGSNRVYVALSTLRKLGLDPILERVRDGYQLDPSVPVRT